MNTHEFDFCVVGGGSAGFAAATSARRCGKTVAIAEGTDPLAGLCILRGCMPSKTLLYSAEVAHTVQRAPEAGIEPNGFAVNMRRVAARKRQIIEGFAAERRLAIHEFPLFRSAPVFVGPHEIEVGDDLIRAKKVLIATGSIINVPEIPGLRETGFVTSDEVLDLEAVPSSFIVLGGGSVACEMAQYLVRLGARTTMLQRSKTVLSSEDDDVSQAVRDGLEADGIEVVTGVALERVERVGDAKHVIASVDGAKRTFKATEIFAALGRRPNIDGLNLDVAGVRVENGRPSVNEYLETSNPDIYAAGDVIGTRELVHVAVYEGQLAAENACSGKRRAMDHAIENAHAVFTDPQVGIAGLTERDCRQRRISYEAASFPFNDHGKAIATSSTRGFVKMLASPDDGRVLGVAFVGPHGSDLIHEAIALLHFKANVSDVMTMPHLHPTMAEIITYPAEELSDRIEHRAYALVTP